MKIGNFDDFDIVFMESEVKNWYTYIIPPTRGDSDKCLMRLSGKCFASVVGGIS